MFDDIRPYRDHEVVAITRKLINEKEFQSSIASFVLPRTYRMLPGLTRAAVKWWLTYRVRNLTCVASLQQEVRKYLLRLIKLSTSGFTFCGQEKLDLSKPSLFISNHRDIALDPALVNFALSKSGTHTAEIAIGDNLLSKSWVSDLMRLNKSFVVKRSEKSKRAMLSNSKSLSAYIHHALTENNQHIWIAQRQGRAKDGIDKTNSALISMLLLNRDKQQPLQDYLSELNIVPVSIAYEFDPCDRDKAKELASIDATGSYQKGEHEDIKSITQGLLGQKGRIHVQFGQPILGEFRDSKAVAKAIDQQIIANYKLFDINNAAFEHQTLTEQQALNEQQGSHSNDGDPEDRVEVYRAWKILKARMSDLDEAQQQWLIAMYANPVFSKKNLQVH